MDIDCNKLFKIWEKICNDSKKKIIDAWDSGSWSSYTETIMGPQNPNSILGKLKDEIHLSIYQEYYSCDAIFFNEDKCLKKEEIQDFLSDEVINAPSPFNQCWVKEIEIHLEHENNIKNLNCPQILGQFKQLSRWEFSNQDFAGYVHYYNNI